MVVQVALQIYQLVVCLQVGDVKILTIKPLLLLGDLANQVAEVLHYFELTSTFISFMWMGWWQEDKSFQLLDLSS